MKKHYFGVLAVVIVVCLLGTGVFAQDAAPAAADAVSRFVSPRLGTLSPWASKAGELLRGAGLPDGPSRMGPPGAERPCIVENGVALLPDRSAFAGSVATADRLIRTIVAEGGASPQDAIKMMTTAPTAAMALGDRGRLAPGLRADLAFWSADWRVTRTMVAGRFVDG